MNNQYYTLQKKSKYWFRPYVVVEVYNNGTYLLQELNGIEFKTSKINKQIKLFKKRNFVFILIKNKSNN